MAGAKNLRGIVKYGGLSGAAVAVGYSLEEYVAGTGRRRRAGKDAGSFGEGTR